MSLGTNAQTLFDKLWEQHLVKTLETGEDLIAMDRIFLHERTGGVALMSLEEAGHKVQAPQRVFCTMDHIVSNKAGRGQNDARMPGGEIFITATREAAARTGINLIDVTDPRQGIVHVIAPELGVALPGASIVCPDSHTCSLGALGAMAWGIGSSEAEHAMATGTLRVRKPRQMRVTVTGEFADGIGAKDLALHLIAEYGAAGGQRSAIEYAGATIRAMPLEARLTLCNLAVEFAAFTAIIAPDDTVYDYLEGREFTPKGELWQKARAYGGTLCSDDGAAFDFDIAVDASDVAPIVTWGTSPEQAVPVTGSIPVESEWAEGKEDSAKRALAYMDLAPGKKLSEIKLDGAFIGSCTNGRLSDLRVAAKFLRGRHIADHVRGICVPGSNAVKQAAEAEGLDKVFTEAGFEWGAPGCAMCFYAGGDTFPPGSRVISTTNRNFEGRQGPGVRTHLANVATVAASAVAGRITDFREDKP